MFRWRFKKSSFYMYLFENAKVLVYNTKWQGRERSQWYGKILYKQTRISPDIVYVVCWVDLFFLCVLLDTGRNSWVHATIIHNDAFVFDSNFICETLDLDVYLTRGAYFSLSSPKNRKKSTLLCLPCVKQGFYLKKTVKKRKKSLPVLYCNWNFF